ncbi:ABCA3 [Mytilus edulis]|uniref:ABCA3 n=1 Tax=Mytilus edulis TaxID=6550 RepID=A0A8S3ULE4_MYTED|nr:ABCA3 [Mytilus edulis]
MASGGQFLLLMWKNWTLQKRKICVTVFEILLPLFFGIILVLIRLLVDPTDYPQDTIWKNSNFSESGLNTIVYTRREILFAPNNTVIRDVMMEVESSLIAQNINLTNIGIKGFDTEKDLLDHHNLYPKNVWGAVVFKSNLSDANVKYDLRVSPVKPSDKWRTRLTYAFAQTTSPRNKDDDGGPPGIHEDDGVKPNYILVVMVCYSVDLPSDSMSDIYCIAGTNTGLFAGGMIYFLTYFPYFFLNNDDQYGAMTLAQKVMACLLGNVAMAFGVKTVAAYEGTGEGAQWSNFYKPPTVDADFTLLTAMIMLLCDTVLYLLITWYVDAVMPGEYGVAEPLYFPFTKNYWCGSKKKEKYEREHSVIGLDPAYFEAEPSDKKAGIAIQHLRKVSH